MIFPSNHRTSHLTRLVRRNGSAGGGLRRRRGFTLVEVMLAVAISAVIFAAVSSGLSYGFALVQVSREKLRANQICLSRVEGIRLCRWDTQLFNTNIVPLTFSDYFYPVGMASQATNFMTYSGTVSLSLCSDNSAISPPPSYASNLCLVTVTVKWADTRATTTNWHSQSVSTWISKTGIQNYVYSH